MPRLNSTRPTIATIGQFCPSHVNGPLRHAAGAGISAALMSWKVRHGDERRRVLDIRRGRQQRGDGWLLNVLRDLLADLVDGRLVGLLGLLAFLDRVAPCQTFS